MRASVAAPPDQRDPSSAGARPDRAGALPGRPVARPAWLDRATALGLAVVLAAYLAVSGWLIAAGEGRPYVFDNNESYSSFWHGYNLYHFGLTSGAGLTDESFSPHPEAHPFVHTHQGNVPRLFSWLLYALGARTVEGHILITTLTLGLAGVGLAFLFFRALGGPLFATVTGLLLATDYVLAAQWSVVTYRVWHGLLLFGALLAVLRVRPRRGRLDDLALLLASAGLFYYELVFCAFASLTVALVAAHRSRADLRGLARTIGVQVLGGAIGIGVLVAQLLIHLGPRATAEDFYLTFVARNAADPAVAERLDQFYRAHNVVFWFNLVDTTGFRAPARFLEHLFQYHFQVYTPLLALLALVVAAGWLLGLALRAPPWPRASVGEGGGLLVSGRLGPSAPGPHVRLRLEALPSPALVPWLPRLGRVARVLAALLLGGAGAALYLAVGRDAAFLGVPGEPYGRRVLAAALGAGLLAGGVGLAVATRHGARLARLLGLDDAPRATPRLVLAALFVLGAALAIRRVVPMYDQTLAPLWHGALSTWLPVAAARAAVVLAVLLGAGLLVLGPRRLLGAGASDRLAPVAGFLGLGFLAFAVVYYLSPGYVVTGYLARQAPLLVFLTAPLLGAALTVLLVLAWRGLGAIAWSRPVRSSGAPREPGAARTDQIGGLSRPVGAPLGAASLGVVALLAAQWSYVQLRYARLLPPDHVVHLARLAEPPFAGASSTTNLYGAPIAAYTGEWSYIDLTLARGEVLLTDDGFVARQELRTFVWFADRGRNPAYRTPDLYVCLRQQGLRTALARATGDLRDVERCGDVPIVARAAAGTTPYLEHRVVARDDGPLDSWAIVRLDWDFPPYLRPLDGAPRGAAVATDLAGGPAAPELLVRYAYAQQDGSPEGDTRVELRGVRPDGTACALAERVGGGPLALPPGLRGTVLVAVTPRSATKWGPEYQGAPLILGGDPAADACAGR